jgi:hypothetical protein
MPCARKDLHFHFCTVGEVNHQHGDRTRKGDKRKRPAHRKTLGEICASARSRSRPISAPTNRATNNRSSARSGSSVTLSLCEERIEYIATRENANELLTIHHRQRTNAMVP